ncbi:hypothetical protein MUK42_35214 [Musa troglodytarum]|uniref:Uncharacterized protein n=1 Tax=Musa troglodytarum TaxID=320322 RepID=A0A9E7FRF3_9LILI|nr:hypothetical protein MUK42_35214 [Musa troglodytarum]
MGQDGPDAHSAVTNKPAAAPSWWTGGKHATMHEVGINAIEELKCVPLQGKRECPARRRICRRFLLVDLTILGCLTSNDISAALVNKLQLHSSWNCSTYRVLCPELISDLTSTGMGDITYQMPVLISAFTWRKFVQKLLCLAQHNLLNFHDMRQENFDHSDRSREFFAQFTSLFQNLLIQKGEDMYCPVEHLRQSSLLEFSQLAKKFGAIDSNSNSLKPC